MKGFLLIPVAVLATLTATFSWKSPATADADKDAIVNTVRSYFDGMMQAKPEYLRTAFHADARLMGLGDDGSVLIIPFERWAASWEGQDPRDAAKYTNKIVSVDVVGTAASVKTDLVWPDVHYVDYLSLLKVGGEWKIVNKIWWEEAP